MHFRQPNGNPTPEVLLLLPAATAPQAGSQTFAIPEGTVWIRSRFLFAGAAGMAELRVAGGTLTTSAAAASIGGRLLVCCLAISL